MQEKCVSKGEKTPWTRARPRLWVPPFMLGIVIYIFKVPLPLNFWRATSVLNQSYNNMTTEIGSVLQESRRHKDILQSSFVDSYNNLTIKTMVMFEWLSSHCPNTSYAMKVDSDIFLNVQKLVDMLLKAPQHRYLTGHVVRYAAVIRDQTSKWFLPVSAFPEPTYPPYAQGLGYVFSLDLPQKILEASLHVKAIYIEDVYVGLCLRHIGIALTDPPHSGLFMEMMPLLTSSCYWTSVITTIPGSSQQLLDVWGMYETQTQSGC
ncbi:beta-1,3-galactosyltransferase 2-like isoform X5 [Seriola aureovittata]|uniref:beta-1,3-galactosyltransferase 2-like isoform X5 n=1 Tax=Seriola aureovittata TaxID=2871759 RepID=UPI0024BDBB6B|nr:beta-1,3-galactosyltransferase 2-like isoform X5 [Seriola aureovittata]